VTTAIVYSKNRAAQLDLLLRSIEENAPDLYDEVHVICKGDAEYDAAYQICALQHPEVVFHTELSLREQTLRLAEQDAHLAFLMDDCVFYHKGEGSDPAEILREDEDVLCFSPRLGLNTTYCYPLRRGQTVEATPAEDGILYWDWRGAECDFSYPASLDGHVWRREDLLPLLRLVTDWSNPNTVEAELARAFQYSDLGRPLMAAHARSSLVGVPVNRTGDTHVDNRFGERYRYELDDLNSAYLGGKRLVCDLKAEEVRAAHVEAPFRLVTPGEP
jgi:hypothetical protein